MNNVIHLFQSTSKGKILINSVDMSLSERHKTLISAIHSHLLATDLQTSGTECRSFDIVILIMLVYCSRLFIRYLWCSNGDHSYVGCWCTVHSRSRTPFFLYSRYYSLWLP